MYLNELIANMTEQQQKLAQDVMIEYTITDHDYRWEAHFLVEDTFHTVDILHRYDDVKDAHCTYCQAADCHHIQAAYIAVAAQLTTPVICSVEEQLTPYSKDDLIYMLALLQHEQEDVLKRFLQPSTYSKQQVYTLIDETLQNYTFIDEICEDAALAGINQVIKNVHWLEKKEPYLAIQHILACIEKLYEAATRCDEAVYELNSVLLDIQLESFLEQISDESLAKFVTDEVLQSIAACIAFPLQEHVMERLWDTVSMLKPLSKMDEEILTAMLQHKDALAQQGYILAPLRT